MMIETFINTLRIFGGGGVPVEIFADGSLFSVEGPKPNDLTGQDVITLIRNGWEWSDSEERWVHP